MTTLVLSDEEPWLDTLCFMTDANLLLHASKFVWNWGCISVLSKNWDLCVTLTAQSMRIVTSAQNDINQSYHDPSLPRGSIYCDMFGPPEWVRYVHLCKKTKQKAEGLKSPKEAKTNLILDNLELINAKVGKIRKEEDLACVPCNATASWGTMLVWGCVRLKILL